MRCVVAPTRLAADAAPSFSAVMRSSRLSFLHSVMQMKHPWRGRPSSVALPLPLRSNTGGVAAELEKSSWFRLARRMGRSDFARARGFSLFIARGLRLPNAEPARFASNACRHSLVVWARGIFGPAQVPVPYNVLRGNREHAFCFKISLSSYTSNHSARSEQTEREEIEISIEVRSSVI